MSRKLAEDHVSMEKFYRLKTPVSWRLNQEAQEYLPGGDSRSTIYYFPYPQFFVRGEGCWLYDADGNRFLDFTGNHTSLILGYGNPEVQRALREWLDLGTCFPGPTEPQIRLARIICERTPSIERVRFTNSGTEATMNAIRAARAFTGRTKVVKAEGAFHGTHDVMSVSIAPDPKQAGPQHRPRPVPHVKGIPDQVFDNVVIMPFNDSHEAQRIIEEHGEEVATVIVEPVMGAAGMIPAAKEYLRTLREVTQKLGALLMFDEVITYRLAPGGAQEYYGVTPDLTCLGKMIGGGLPLGAFGGRVDVMSLFDPSAGGPSIHHGGSFNANPVSLVAGATILEQLTLAVYRRLAYLGEKLRRSLQELFTKMEVPAQVTGLGSLFGIHLTDRSVRNYRDAQLGDTALRHQIFLGMLNEGIVMDPRGAGCLSVAIGEREVESFVSTMQRVLEQIDSTRESYPPPQRRYLRVIQEMCSEKIRTLHHFVLLVGLLLVAGGLAAACNKSATPVVIEEEAGAVPVPAKKQPIIFADLNWDSAQLQNAIARFITEKGYGYPTDAFFGGTTPLWQGLFKGDIQVIMEVWLPDQQDVWDKGVAEGAVVPVGKSLDDNWQSAFVVPSYVVKGDDKRGIKPMAPDLETPQDMENYKNLFVTMDSGGKAVLVNCPAAWKCSEINEKKVKAYGLGDHIQLRDPGAAAALFASLQGAYDKGKPWLGYMWAPTILADSLDLTILEEPSCGPGQEPADGCAYPTARVLIAVHPSLTQRAPGVVEMLRRYDFTAADQVKAKRYMSDKGTTFTETAVWWLKNNEEVWSEWVPADVAQKVRQALVSSQAGIT